MWYHSNATLCDNLWKLKEPRKNIYHENIWSDGTLSDSCPEVEKNGFKRNIQGQHQAPRFLGYLTF